MDERSSEKRGLNRLELDVALTHAWAAGSAATICGSLLRPEHVPEPFRLAMPWSLGAGTFVATALVLLGAASLRHPRQKLSKGSTLVYGFSVLYGSLASGLLLYVLVEVLRAAFR